MLLDAKRFDEALASRPGERVIWTASGIGRRIGRSPDYVRKTLAYLPGSPVKRINKSYVAIESDLLAFIRRGLSET